MKDQRHGHLKDWETMVPKSNSVSYLLKCSFIVIPPCLLSVTAELISSDRPGRYKCLTQEA